MPEVDEITPETMDSYIGAKIMILHCDAVDQWRVRGKKRDVEGNTIGRANGNPIINILTYEVELEDRSMRTYSENVIA